MGLNVLDLVLGGLLLLSVLGAVRNGVTKELIRIASLLFGVGAALWGYGVLAQQLEPWVGSSRAASVVAFVLIFLGCLLAGGLVARILAGVWSWTGLRWLDRLFGAAFGVLRGLLIASVALLGLIAFQPLADTSRVIANSKIAPWVLHIAQTAASLAPKSFREAFRRGVSRIEEERARDRI